MQNEEGVPDNIDTQNPDEAPAADLNEEKELEPKLEETTDEHVSENVDEEVVENVDQEEVENVDQEEVENVDQEEVENRVENTPGSSLLTGPDASIKLLIEDFLKHSQVLEQFGDEKDMDKEKANIDSKEVKENNENVDEIKIETNNEIINEETSDPQTASKNPEILETDNAVEIQQKSEQVILENKTSTENGFKTGTTKDLKGFWVSQQNTSNTKLSETPKLPIQLPKESDRSIVENLPEVKEGVVKSGETTNEISVESGYTKKLANMFMQTPTKQNLSEGDNLKDVSNIGAGVKALMGKFMGNGEFKNLQDAIGSLEKSCYTPFGNKAQANLTEKTKNEGTEIVAQGTTKNLIQKFVNNNNVQPAVKFADVRKILEEGKAFESGVFENTPEKRDDVIKSDYIENCNVIPANATRSAREKFTKLSEQSNEKLAQQTNSITSPTKVN